MIADLAALTSCWDLAGRCAARDPGAPTRTDWTRRELLLHQLLDARRLLVTLATPADEAPDTDHVSYWRSFPPGRPGASEHADFVRRVAAAYGDDGLLAEWQDTTAAAVHAARLADPSEVVSTQGHRLAVADLVRTVLVEATLHLLDHDVDVPTAPPVAVELTTETMSGLLGGPWPSGDDMGWLLRTTGRAGLTAQDRATLGPRVDRLPLLA